jgi:down-regulator of transcription 1
MADAMPVATVRRAVVQIVEEASQGTFSVELEKRLVHVLAASCAEFVKMVASEATAVCRDDRRKSIASTDVVAGARKLEFSAYVDAKKRKQAKSRALAMERSSKKKKLLAHKLTEEELRALAEEQESLFRTAHQNQRGREAPVVENVQSD